MKQHLSVFGLAARSTIYKVLLLFLGITAIQIGLFHFTLEKHLPNPVALEWLFTESRIMWVAGLGFVALSVLLSVSGTELGGSKLRYTLRRLSLPEKQVLLWCSLYNALCFFLFWVAQVVVAVLLCQIYLSRAPAAHIGNQTLFLAFYRQNYLHSLLPLAETSRYVRNVVFVITLGLASAHFAYLLRRDKVSMGMVALMPIVLIGFPRAMGSFGADMLHILLSIGIAGSIAVGLLPETEKENEV